MTPDKTDKLNCAPAILADLLPVVNYALEQNRLPLLRSLVLDNSGGEERNGLTLTVSAQPPFCREAKQTIDRIPADSRFDVRDLDLRLDGSWLAGLTEKTRGELTFRLMDGEQELSSACAQVEVLAFDEWMGSNCYPELLASFVTPNHPSIAPILLRAAQLQEQWGGEPSLTGYLFGDPDVVLRQAGAIYAALQEQNIVYSVSPASFETSGQRVRLCNDVLEKKLGNCLELTLLYAACLEASGLNPLVVIKSGHAFAGLWLESRTFLEAVQYDSTLLTKRLAGGVGEVAVCECTSLVSGRNISFDEARKAGERQLVGEEPIEYIVDIRRARLSRITPLPQRIATEEGWKIFQQERPEEELTGAPEKLAQRLEVDETLKAEAASKMAQWERKLLDLGLRNALINLRMSKNMVPLLAHSLDELEDVLSSGKELLITYRPSEWMLPAKEVSFENLHSLDEIADLLRSEFENSRLRSALSEKELGKAMKELFRAARASLEENGANTLYLAMGLLRWYEKEKDGKARYAPIILIPVDVSRRGANQSYQIRIRDEEAQINITMLEKLKQDFDITVTGLDPLPRDKRGIDTRKVFTLLRKAVMSQNRWDILESAYLGIFSFTQFVMWNDMRNRGEELLRNKIVASLVAGRLTWEAEELTPPAQVSEDQALIPIPADASQLFAIQAAARGESFVLHGPPGTGKSQTITALIANALAQGRTVLFVAEKRAALEVVQRRLSAIGLAPFCLELHSNKSRKRDVLEQLKRATEVTRDLPPEEYQKRAQQLADLRGELDEYVLALHQKLPCGKTLFQLLDGYESAKHALDLPGRLKGAEELDGEALRRQNLILERLVAAGQGVGHPKDHPLLMVGCSKYSQRLRMELPELLKEYYDAMEDHQRAQAEFDRLIEHVTGDRLKDFEQSAALAEELKCWEELPRDWAQARDLEQYFRKLQETLRNLQTANQMKANLLKNFHPSFLQLEGEALLAQYQQTKSRWALGKMMGLNEMTRELSGHAKGHLERHELGSHLNNLAAWQLMMKKATEGFKVYGKSILPLLEDGGQGWKALEEKIRKAKESALRFALLPNGENIRIRFAGSAEARRASGLLTESWEKLQSLKEEVYSLLGLEQLPEDANYIVGENLRLGQITAHLGQLKAWMAYQAVAQEARSHGLEVVVDAYENGMAHETVIPAWQKTLCRTLAVRAIDKSEVLSAFSGPLFNEKIEQFRRMDEEHTRLTQKEIFCRLAARLPNFSKEAAQSSELNILQKAIRSGGRGQSICCLAWPPVCL